MFIVAINVEAMDNGVSAIGKKVRPCVIGWGSRSAKLIERRMKNLRPKEMSSTVPIYCVLRNFDNRVVCELVTRD